MSFLSESSFVVPRFPEDSGGLPLQHMSWGHTLSEVISIQSFCQQEGFFSFFLFVLQGQAHLSLDFFTTGKEYCKSPFQDFAPAHLSL